MVNKISCGNGFDVVRDGFRERGALGHLSFWGPTQVSPFGHLS